MTSDVQLVDVVELVRLRLGGAGHAGELVVEAEIILNRDRRERLRFAIDLHAFLRFDRLVQAVAPAAARHFAAGVFIDDDDFVFLDDVMRRPSRKGNRRAATARCCESARPARRNAACRSAFILIFLLVREQAVQIDVGEFADQIRQDESIRIIRVEEGAALLREIGFVRFLVDREEELFLQREEFFLPRVLVK